MRGSASDSLDLHGFWAFSIFFIFLSLINNF